MARVKGFKEEYIELGYKLALLGAIDKQIADIMGFTETTINNWKLKHPKFAQSLREGKDIADSNIAMSLYRRGMGYSHVEEKIFNDNGTILRAETVKHYPPDTTACIFWLKNRQRDRWRDKPDEISDTAAPAPVKVEFTVKDARIGSRTEPPTE